MTATPEQHSVLVVGDQPEASDRLCGWAMQAGYPCDAVESVEDAYRALRIGGPFVALILDVQLGAGVPGQDLARFATQLHPGLGVICLAPEGSTAARAAAVPGGQVLAAPISAEALADALRKVSV